MLKKLYSRESSISNSIRCLLSPSAGILFPWHDPRFQVICNGECGSLLGQ